jgi:hypothetical protein
MVWKAETLPGQMRELPRLLIGMSFSEVSLGGLLSSRARLRFPRRTHSGTTGSRSSSNLQRTANCRTTLCLTKGRTPSIRGKPTITPIRSPLGESNGFASRPAFVQAAFLIGQIQESHVDLRRVQGLSSLKQRGERPASTDQVPLTCSWAVFIDPTDLTPRVLSMNRAISFSRFVWHSQIVATFHPKAWRTVLLCMSLVTVAFRFAFQKSARTSGT